LALLTGLRHSTFNTDFALQAPRNIGNFIANLHEISNIEISEAFIAMSAYQNRK
jgi:hypothetical protein